MTKPKTLSDLAKEKVALACPGFNAKSLIDRYWVNGTALQQIQILRIWIIWGRTESETKENGIAVTRTTSGTI